MPQRSNTFQRLALLVHERLGKDWIVEESHMFTDLVTGELREVDIVAQTMVGTYPIFLSIECRDQSRPADVLWIEGVAKKHEHLPTSKLVLWSRSGFTKSAALKAQALKIEAISQAEAAQADWVRLARELIGGQVQHVRPSYNAFIDVDSQEGEPRRLEQVENAAWFNFDGIQVGTVRALIQYIANNNQTRTVVLDHTSSGPGNFYVELMPPEPWFTDLPEGGQAQIRRIGVSIDTVTEKVALDTASAVSEGKVLTLASSKVASGTLEVLFEESPDGTSSYVSTFIPRKT
ncbi:hypothetical protein [Noviherbaspirillum sp.]|mgnify:CR=1 FL=1|uniref:hypothetical protein n=1 Tax=Noviherbaspirillum sp. TaxID=1926288 RepID=UPI002FE27571